jgi:hypothetical protein
MDIISILSLVAGLVGVAFAAVTHQRTRKNEFQVRIHLAKMMVTLKIMEEYAAWAVDHYSEIHAALDAEDTASAKRKISEAVLRGSLDAMAVNRNAHELKRDVRALQIVLFKKAEDLTTDGEVRLIKAIDAGPALDRTKEEQKLAAASG